ncbi:oxygenase MpaB family protein [Amycolatopsis umgeniensis]|uniref:Uncharacterized protein (DUF2236 family) n=1 Tax=Amycolatopsis umgeniensis TaxID=336628 RepID=A0A841AYR3_9PSEU|nr:oxygenase MpaB family protein [Amycolatopsis umgeniensis]MBB5852087.1 uncharacterized protein (DUF2236 family) [Amycolatopsis umgeniensis]
MAARRKSDVARKSDPAAVQPHQDYGFFGPDSVAWKVWSYPTSLTVGFQRAVTVEELDPALVAAVDETRAIRNRPRTRYDRTLRYFAMVVFAGSHDLMKAADILVKVHSKGIGIEPLSGEPYDANDPKSQLWIHLTAWHSILYAYEKYGPGKLDEAEEKQYWRECAVAAEFQTCSVDAIPRGRAGIQAYFETMRPKLVGSEVARSTMDHLLHAEVMFPPVPAVFRPIALIVARVLRIGTIATMPHWMREMSGLRQGRLLDALVTPVLKIAFRIPQLNRRLKLALLKRLSPATVSVVAPVILEIPPLNPVTLTPAEAREKYGYPKPADAHLEWRAKQHEKVFGGKGKPSDAGLLESEPILGSLT